MTGSDHYPPPGWQPAPTGGGLPAPPPPVAAPAAFPGHLGPVHRPGAIPLRPLRLGDLYDGAFKIIRFNPRATVGSAVLVAAVAGLVPVLVTGVVSLLTDLSLDPTGTSVTNSEAGWAVTIGSILLGQVFSSLGLVLVTGMVAHVCQAAAVGRRLSLGEAWAATRGSRWRLIGLALLLGLMLLLVVAAYVAAGVAVALTAPGLVIALFFLITGPAFLALLCWLWVRVHYLPVPALMIERIGVLAAIGRGFRLTRRQFWRTFGIGLLTVLVTNVISSIVGIPFSIAVEVVPFFLADTRYVGIVIVVLMSLSTVLSAAFVTPFTSTVTSLQYLDQRMRKEAYDVELMIRAGIAPS